MRARSLRLMLLIGLALFVGSVQVRTQPDVGPYPCPPPCRAN